MAVEWSAEGLLIDPKPTEAELSWLQKQTRCSGRNGPPTALKLIAAATLLARDQATSARHACRLVMHVSAAGRTAGHVSSLSKQIRELLPALRLAMLARSMHDTPSSMYMPACDAPASACGSAASASLSAVGVAASSVASCSEEPLFAIEGQTLSGEQFYEVVLEGAWLM